MLDNFNIEKKLNQNKFYKDDSLKFENLQAQIYANSSDHNRIELDNLLSLIFSMKSKEFYIAYQTGFYDEINFNTKMKDDWLFITAISILQKKLDPKSSFFC